MLPACLYIASSPPIKTESPFARFVPGLVFPSPKSSLLPTWVNKGENLCLPVGLVSNAFGVFCAPGIQKPIGEVYLKKRFAAPYMAFTPFSFMEPYGRMVLVSKQPFLGLARAVLAGQRVIQRPSFTSVCPYTSEDQGTVPFALINVYGLNYFHGVDPSHPQSGGPSPFYQPIPYLYFRPIPLSLIFLLYLLTSLSHPERQVSWYSPFFWQLLDRTSRQLESQLHKETGYCCFDRINPNRQLLGMPFFFRR
ncbi:hypothetical protein IFM89_032400 [Coptis chinensis]|uniref:Uncharacterized protein n=1 Tax=Coptis chinensis TaxID=261450 RepID=A0A835LT46_9MAGN|nr:hypothetical protein IFM89_032400 [Coptis chinensis]